jgi:hypothetical protein
LQGHLIGHHDASRIVAGITPGALLHRRAAVPCMVTGHHDEPRVEEGGGQVQVAA